MTTRPLTGKSVFEFWRHDAAGFGDAMESTLQTIYRTCQVRFVPQGPDDWSVEVRVSESLANRPTPQLVSPTQAATLYRMERGSSRYAERISRRGLEGELTVSMGDNEALAEELREKILARLPWRQAGNDDGEAAQSQ